MAEGMREMSFTDEDLKRVKNASEGQCGNASPAILVWGSVCSLLAREWKDTHCDKCGSRIERIKWRKAAGKAAGK